MERAVVPITVISMYVALGLGLRNRNLLWNLFPSSRHAFNPEGSRIYASLSDDLGRGSAVVIGSLIIPGIGVDAWQALRGGDTVTAICFVGIIVLLWLLKGRLESGRARANWVRRSRPRRRSARN